jgi:Ca2+-transporting ATPase
MTDFAREALLSKLYIMTSKTLRCLGLAFKEELGELSDYDGDTHPGHQILLESTNYELVETGLIFVGMVGLRVSHPPLQDLAHVELFRLSCFFCLYLA